MATSTAKISEQALQTTVSLLQDLFGSTQQCDFAVRLWDGSIWRPNGDYHEPARFTIVLQHPGALRKMFLPPNNLTLGEAYIYNDFDIEGDIEVVFQLAEQFTGNRWGKLEQARFGKRLLDIGCGWGGLVIYAAQHYGVQAYGITLSETQAELAQRRIEEAGLIGKCKVEVRDYREVTEANSFDKIVSVGMFEHVGEALLLTYFKQAWQLLRPGGVFLNHGIASESLGRIVTN